MGCASSKPSKSKKDNKKLNKKSKSNDVSLDGRSTDDAASNSDAPFELTRDLLDQIKRNEVQVVEYIAKLVQRDLNNELTKHATSRTVNSQSPDLASTTLAVQSQQENEDLIVDVTSKAVNNLVNTPLPNTTLSHKSMTSSLRSWKFICKNQTNRARIIDLTSDTINDCLQHIKDETTKSEEKNFDLLKYLTQQSALTPPQTPEKVTSQEDVWNESAVLLNRTKANQIARLLFLSNKARPVIHPSNRIKDAYFVNRELSDKSQVTISQQEIDEILNNSTYKNNPHITPVTGRKLDMVKDILPNNTTTADTEAADQSTAVDDSTALDTVTNLTATAPCLDCPEDYIKVECIRLTDQVEEKLNTSDDQTTNFSVQQETTAVEISVDSAVQSTDTNVVAVEKTEQASEATDKNGFLEEIVTEINNLQASIDNETTSKDTDKIIEDSTTTVTPPSTPETVSNDVQKDETSAKTEEVVKPDETDSTEHDVTQLNSVEVDVAANVANTQAAVADESHNTNNSSNNEDDKVSDNAEQATVNESKTVEENGTMDSTLKQQLLEDRSYNNDSFKNGPPVNGTDAENNAATTIQAGFKGEATRQDNEKLNEVVDESKKEEFQRQNTVEMKNTLETYSSNMFDEVMDKAATKIQSNIRGYLTRKSLKEKGSFRKKVESEVAELNQEEKNEIVVDGKKEGEDHKESEKVEQPVADKVEEAKPENKPVEEVEVVVEEAKPKKKKRNRKKSPKQDESEKAASGNSNEASPSPTLPTEEEQAAATKIQATFKGYKVRKDIKDKK